MKVSYCIGITLLGCAGAASAQSERRVDISLSNQLTYDTNVLRAFDSSDINDSPKRGDFSLAPAANIDILLPVGRQAVFLAGSVGYNFYANNSRLDREMIGLNGGVNLAAGTSCTGVASVDYSRGQMDDLAIIDGFDPSNVIETRAYSGRVNCGEGQGLTSGLGYTHSESDNSSILRESGNYKSDTIDVSLGYSRPVLGTISLYGSYTDTTYSNRFFLAGPEILQDGVEVFSIGLRGNRQIGSMLSGGVSLGYTKVEPKLPGVPGFTGPSYSANLTFTPGTSLRFNLAMGRSVDQSNLLNISYSITDSIQLDTLYAMSDSLNLVAGVGYVNRQLEASPVDIPSPIGFPAFQAGNDKNYRVFGGFRYTRGGPWSLNGDLSYNKRTSDNNLFDYGSTRASLGMAYHF